MKSLQTEVKRLNEHLEKVHKCDFICLNITTIEPIDALYPVGNVLPKVPSNHLMHQWRIDSTHPPAPVDEGKTPDEIWPNEPKVRKIGAFIPIADVVEQHTGWWWRKPWGWLLKHWNAFVNHNYVLAKTTAGYEPTAKELIEGGWRE